MGESVLCYTVKLTRKEAYSAEHAVKALEAENREKLELKAKETWREIESGELKPDDEVVPSCCIYTIKRDGRYKCRLVAIGCV